MKKLDREDHRGYEPPPGVTRIWRLKDGRRIGAGDDLWFNERQFWWRRETFLTFWPPRWRKPRFYPWKPKR